MKKHHNVIVVLSSHVPSRHLQKDSGRALDISSVREAWTFSFLAWCPEQEPAGGISCVQSSGARAPSLRRRVAGAGLVSLVMSSTGRESVPRTWGKPVELLWLSGEMRGICNFPLCICMHRDVIKTACGLFPFPAVSGGDQPRASFDGCRVLSLWFVPNAMSPGSSSGHCIVPKELPVCKKRSSPSGEGRGRGELCRSFPSYLNI